MPSWDVFHSERLEVLRNLTEAEIRAAVTAGSLRDDDLIRPAGTTQPWVRLVEIPGLIEAPGGESDRVEPAAVDEPMFPATIDAPESPATEPEPPAPPVLEGEFAPPSDDDLEAVDDLEAPKPEAERPRQPEPVPGADPGAGASALNALLGDEEPGLPVASGLQDIAEDVEPDDEDEDEDEDEFDPQDEDEEAADFTLAPSASRAVEPIDLTAMVDVSFQLILFFLVAATAVYLKTLEIPEPNPEKDEAAAVQPRTIEDLESDFILVEIDPGGAFTIDREPVEASVAALADRLRTARRETGRTAMLLSADSAAHHRLAVMAYDAANDLGLRIAIARPAAVRAQAAATPPRPGG